MFLKGLSPKTSRCFAPCWRCIHQWWRKISTSLSRASRAKWCAPSCPSRTQSPVRLSTQRWFRCGVKTLAVCALHDWLSVSRASAGWLPHYPDNAHMVNQREPIGNQLSTRSHWRPYAWRPHPKARCSATEAVRLQSCRAVPRGAWAAATSVGHM